MNLCAAYAIKGREVRKYLIDHPGATSDEVKAATGGYVTNLQRRGLAHWKRVDGVVRWYVKDGAKKVEKKRDWDWRWNPDALHWERGEEVVETRWERYENE